MKRFHAEYHGFGEATVYEKPGLFRRTRERQATVSQLPGGGLRWRWYDGSDVTGAAKAALDSAYRDHVVRRTAN